MHFHVQEGLADDWTRLVDTNMTPPLDITDPGKGIVLASLDYEVGGRSVVVLTRTRRAGGPGQS